MLKLWRSRHRIVRAVRGSSRKPQERARED